MLSQPTLVEVASGVLGMARQSLTEGIVGVVASGAGTAAVGGGHNRAEDVGIRPDLGVISSLREHTTWQGDGTLDDLARAVENEIGRIPRGRVTLLQRLTTRGNADDTVRGIPPVDSRLGTVDSSGVSVGPVIGERHRTESRLVPHAS